MTKRKRYTACLLAVLCIAVSLHVPAAAKASDRHTISGFPIIWQMPELPTGCEVTALTMAMRYYGYNVSKVTMASRYLPKVSPYFYYGSGGRLYGPDMDKYFVGSPFNSGGYICGPTALCTAADGYFKANGIHMKAKDISGSEPRELYALVEQGTPVVVMVTINMVNRHAYFSWYTSDGRPMSISHNDHGAVLIGYTPTTVTLADPLAGRVTYSRSRFESVFRSRGKQCVILEEPVYKSGYTDVPDNRWFSAPITYCREKGLMSGVGDKKFLPDSEMTRSMLAGVLYRAAGQPEVSSYEIPFTDVKSGKWYTSSVLWASETGIIAGYGNGLFGTDDPVTREQVVASIWRMEGEPEATPGQDFEDEGSISVYALTAVDWAHEKGIISGKPGNLFDPQASMTRAEVATVLYNYTSLKQKESQDARL